MITINNIIDAISVALNDEFGDSYEIYTEDVKQDLTEPCFSILCLKPSVKQVLGKRYFRKHAFCIHYFPEADDDKRSECFDVQERLMSCLETITVDDDLIRGTQMEGEVVDDVLSFLVNYDMYVYKDEDAEDAMETLTQSTSVEN